MVHPPTYSLTDGGDKRDRVSLQELTDLHITTRDALDIDIILKLLKWSLIILSCRQSDVQIYGELTSDLMSGNFNTLNN